MSDTLSRDEIGRLSAQFLRHLSRGMLVLLLVPIVAVYPIVYLLNDAEELADRHEESALTIVPGFDPSSVGPAVGYSVLFLGVVAVFSWFAILRNQFSSPVVFGGILTITFFLGVYSTIRLYERGFERDLAQRMALSIFLGIVAAVSTVLIVWYTQGTRILGDLLFYVREPSISVMPIAATASGAVAANSYVVKSDAITQRKKRRGEEVGSESQVHTKRHIGTDISDDNGVDLIERLTDGKWVVPDNLHNRAEVKSTRRIDTFKDITRVLRVSSKRVERTIPNTKFHDEKSKHRSDYRDRKDVAPSGFSSASYSFYVPNSKQTSSCGNCAGRGYLDCSSCGSRGKVECGNCGGGGTLRCGNCSGAGKITVDETCGVCRGSGETSNGWECSKCGGYGTIEKTKRCPNCSSGSVRCSTCGGKGNVTCGDCGGSGRHGCGQCDGCGKITSFEYVEREYQPQTEYEFRNNSVPVSIIENADGTRISKETDENPRASGHYRIQEETRKIPVVSAIYEYLGDRWELFEVEGSLKYLDHPRDFDKQFRVLQGVGVLSFAALALAAYYPL